MVKMWLSTNQEESPNEEPTKTSSTLNLDFSAPRTVKSNACGLKATQSAVFYFRSLSWLRYTQIFI